MVPLGCHDALLPVDWFTLADFACSDAKFQQFEPDLVDQALHQLHHPWGSARKGVCCGTEYYAAGGCKPARDAGHNAGAVVQSRMYSAILGRRLHYWGRY